MDILQYLIALLQTHKQIGIEGLGTLYKKKKPGRYDAGTHSFLPPSYTLEFTTDILENNNLAQYIQNKRGISEESARYFINQFVTETQSALTNGQYQLENLGIFNNTNGKLNFTPSKDINTGFDFFALPPVTASPLGINEPENELAPPQETETLKEVLEPNYYATAENIVHHPAEPAIEQIKVPEFEQEIAKLSPTDESFFNTSEIVEEAKTNERLEETKKPEPSSNKPEEGLTPSLDQTVIIDEETELSSNVLNKKTAVEEEAKSFEDNQATEHEVFEEITEINPIADNIETNKAIFNEEKRIWDFEEENVVSEEDIFKNADENTAHILTNFDKEQLLKLNEEEEDFKLTSTTQDWNFDSVGPVDAKEDNVLIGEFDELDEEPIHNQKSKVPNYIKFMLGLLVLVVGLMVTYFIKPALFENFSKNTINPDQKIAVPIERSDLKTQKDSLDFADSIMKTAEKVGLDVQPAKDTLKVTTAKTEIKPSITYDIIAAAFAKQSEVDEYINYMKKKGFDAKVANMPGKIYKKISIASFNNIDSAEKSVVKFRKQLKNPKIYVQKIKNN